MLSSDFEYQRVDVEGLTVNCAVGGSGPPVLLLHGYPQNHLMWRQVAPALAQDHTVVLADLRGYGDSDKPVPDAAGDVYSKRSMARDHFLPEEAPELVIEALRDFLRLPSGP